MMRFLIAASAVLGLGTPGFGETNLLNVPNVVTAQEPQPQPTETATGSARSVIDMEALAPTPPVLKFGEGRKTVTIDLATMEVTFGPDYQPDEAAREFWETLGRTACGRP